MKSGSEVVRLLLDLFKGLLHCAFGFFHDRFVIFFTGVLVKAVDLVARRQIIERDGGRIQDAVTSAAYGRILAEKVLYP